MKKSILILCATFSLTAFAYKNWSVPETSPPACRQAPIDLVYAVDSRFMATISKEDLHRATSVLDIVPRDAESWWYASFESVKVALLHDDYEMAVDGDEKDLNAAQTILLQSADYSTDFYIKARGTTKHPVTGKIEDYVYYLTIVPEKEAAYAGGYDALIAYLRENSREQTAIIEEDRLQPGRVNFTVTKEGTVSNVNLESSSGYPSVDQALIELIANMPGKWEAAENSKGEKVAQELVFFFGMMGC